MNYEKIFFNDSFSINISLGFLLYFISTLIYGLTRFPFFVIKLIRYIWNIKKGNIKRNVMYIDKESHKIRSLNPLNNSPNLDIYNVLNKTNNPKRPIIITIIGGAWTINVKEYNILLINTYLKLSEYIFICPNYGNIPYQNIRDMINNMDSISEWIRLELKEGGMLNKMGGDPDSIYIISQSAGGHLVLNYLLLRGIDQNYDGFSLEIDQMLNQTENIDQLDKLYLVKDKVYKHKKFKNMYQKIFDENSKTFSRLSTIKHYKNLVNFDKKKYIDFKGVVFMSAIYDIPLLFSDTFIRWNPSGTLFFFSNLSEYIDSIKNVFKNLDLNNRLFSIYLMICKYTIINRASYQEILDFDMKELKNNKRNISNQIIISTNDFKSEKSEVNRQKREIKNRPNQNQISQYRNKNKTDKRLVFFRANRDPLSTLQQTEMIYRMLENLDDRDFDLTMITYQHTDHHSALIDHEMFSTGLFENLILEMTNQRKDDTLEILCDKNKINKLYNIWFYFKRLIFPY